MNGIKQFRKNKQGFLLVDSVIGVLILAIGLAALAALYMQGTNVGVKSDKLQAAVQVAGQEMERLKKADGKSLAEVKELINAGMEKGLEDDDGKFVAMHGYTPEKTEGATAKDRFEIQTTLEGIPVVKVESGKLANYLVTVKVTWYDPQKIDNYKVNGYITVMQE